MSAALRATEDAARHLAEEMLAVYPRHVALKGGILSPAELTTAFAMAAAKIAIAAGSVTASVCRPNARGDAFDRTIAMIFKDAAAGRASALDAADHAARQAGL